MVLVPIVTISDLNGSESFRVGLHVTKRLGYFSVLG
jgi:hypothetical protein